MILKRFKEIMNLEAGGSKGYCVFAQETEVTNRAKNSDSNKHGTKNFDWNKMPRCTKTLNNQLFENPSQLLIRESKELK
jgi:hypothetical protein